MADCDIGKATMTDTMTEMTCEQIILACDTARGTRESVEQGDDRHHGGDIFKKVAK